MPLPMFGTWTVTVNAITPFSIHGDKYVELHVTRTDEDQSSHVVRVPNHAFKSTIIVGGTVTITFLMGQVTEVK